MKSGELISKLLENDGSSVLAGCFEVRNSNDRAVLRAVAEKVIPKRPQVEKVELGGGVVSNKHWLQLTFKKLELSKSEVCFCALYPQSEFYDPEKEQKLNNVVTKLMARNFETWSTEHICHCKNCGQCFEVQGEGGWHVPWWKWSKTEI